MHHNKVNAEPLFLLLDKPTHHLDIESIDALIDGINGCIMKLACTLDYREPQR